MLVLPVGGCKMLHAAKRRYPRFLNGTTRYLENNHETAETRIAVLAL
jgi:hypothetical protein